MRFNLALPVVATLILAGCASTVPLEPAPDAINALCAEVIVRLPETVDSLAARETNAQATGAWGTPASVILHCGVPIPSPTATLPCITVEGVDWLRDDSNDPNFAFITYGRDPAVEVIVDDTKASALNTLTDLAFAVGQLPVTGACVSPG